MVEKKMFGGVAFLLNGNMAVGVNKDDLIVRIDAALHDKHLAHKHVRSFDLSGGRPMKRMAADSSSRRQCSKGSRTLDSSRAGLRRIFAEKVNE